MIKTLHVDTDYQDIFALSQFAFQYQLSEAELDKKRKEAWRHTIWAHMDGDQIAAKLHLIPLSIYIGGKEFKMGGVSSVATWPEYRRKGMVKDLLKHALQHMKENGQTVSYLHPFSVSFYRQYGWELAFNEKAYSIPIEKLKKKWNVNGYVRRIKATDSNVLNTMYHKYAKSYSGTLVRDEKWWEQRVLNDTVNIAIAYDEHDQPEGYILFEVKDKVLTVIELVHLSLHAWQQLLQFISNHDSMADKVEMVVPENDSLPLLVDEPSFEQKIEPYFMARIVDANEFLNEYPFENVNPDMEISLHIMDKFLPENSGVFLLHKEDTGLTCTKINEKVSPQTIQCTIQQLTSMLFGYTRPLKLFEIGLLQGEKGEVEKLEKIIPKQQSYFADYF